MIPFSEVVSKLFKKEKMKNNDFKLSYELYKCAKLMNNSTNNKNIQHLLSTCQTCCFPWWKIGALRTADKYCISSSDVLTHLTLTETLWIKQAGLLLSSFYRSQITVTKRDDVVGPHS